MASRNTKLWGFGSLAASAAAAGFLFGSGIIQSEPPKTDVECLSDLLRNTQGLSMEANKAGQGILEFTSSPEVKQHVANYADCLQRYAEGQKTWSIHLGRN